MRPRDGSSFEAFHLHHKIYSRAMAMVTTTLSLSPLSPPSSLGRHCCTFAPSQLSGSILRPNLASNPPITSAPLRKKRNTVLVQSSNSDGPKRSSRYLDENGVVDDLDGYLNELSLEYDSVWDTKPSWCQPWTITLTGVLIIASSWVVLRSVIITSLAASLIGAWWYIFLYSYPKQYSDMIAERRKKVTTGVEDTFGLRKTQ